MLITGKLISVERGLYSMQNTDLTKLAIDFRVEVMFPFLGQIRDDSKLCNLEFLKGMAAASSKGKQYLELIERFSCYFNDWLPFLKAYPETPCLFTSEDFYWDHYACYPDGSLVEPESTIFSLMSGMDSAAIYSEKPIVITHNTSKKALAAIMEKGYLDKELASEMVSRGKFIYCYSEQAGLVADVFGDVIIRMKINQPWVRIVICNDTTIKPLGEVMVLDNLPIEDVEIYDVKEYLNKEVEFFNSEELFKFFGIKVHDFEEIEEYKQMFNVTKEEFRRYSDKTNSIYGYCWIKPILNHIVAGDNVESFS